MIPLGIWEQEKDMGKEYGNMGIGKVTFCSSQRSSESFWDSMTHIKDAAAGCPTQF